MRTFEKIALVVCISILVLSVIALARMNGVSHRTHIMVNNPPPPSNIDIQLVADNIVDRYNIDRELAHSVAQAADNHQYADFPKAEDIIAIVAIESSFNPKAKSKLKKDPAYGLTQIRHQVWKKQIGNDDMSNVDNQIRHGAAILAHYYARTKNKDKAIMAYNVGITAALRGKKNEEYLRRYNHELVALAS